MVMAHVDILNFFPYVMQHEPLYTNTIIFYNRHKRIHLQQLKAGRGIRDVLDERGIKSGRTNPCGHAVTCHFDPESLKRASSRVKNESAVFPHYNNFIFLCTSFDKIIIIV